jgi:hypothetical protein
VTPRRRLHIGPLLLTGVLGLVGSVVLLFALGRPSAGRFLAAGLLLGAAAVVRYHDLHRDDPRRHDRTAQVRSLVWSVLIAVVFVGASLLLNELLTD